MGNNYIKVEINYSFWRHPIQYIKDMKYRKIMEVMVNYDWEHVGRERLQEKMKDYIISKGTC